MNFRFAPVAAAAAGIALSASAGMARELTYGSYTSPTHTTYVNGTLPTMERITERTAAGRVQARARGVKFGRKAALTPHQQSEALERLAAGDTQRTVAALFDVSQATISRLVGR